MMPHTHLASSGTSGNITLGNVPRIFPIHFMITYNIYVDSQRH